LTVVLSFGCRDVQSIAGYSLIRADRAEVKITHDRICAGVSWRPGAIAPRISLRWARTSEDRIGLRLSCAIQGPESSNRSADMANLKLDIIGP